MMDSLEFKIPEIRDRALELSMQLREKQKAIDEFFCSDRYMHAATHAEILSLQRDFHLDEKEAIRDELRQRLQVICDCPLMHGSNRAEIESYLQWVATDRARIFKGKKPVHGTYARYARDSVSTKQQEAIRMLSILDAKIDMEAIAHA